MAPSGLSTTR
nr:unnamed protein product [Callosobruchus analis]